MRRDNATSVQTLSHRHASTRARHPPEAVQANQKDSFDLVLSRVQKVGRLRDAPRLPRFDASLGAQEGRLWIGEEEEGKD